jgi:2'-5' RNA ligase
VVTFPKIDNVAEWSNILAVRDRYDPLAVSIAPHLTLVFPFEDHVSDRALHEHVLGAVSIIPSFGVTLCGITAHENAYLFLNVKRGNDQLIHLHDVLYSGPLAAHHVRMHTFVPHMTVGRLSPGELTAALDATSGFTSPIHADVAAVSVYRIEPDGSRPVLFEIALQPVGGV